MTNTTRKDPKEIFLSNLRLRFFKGLDYLALFIYSLVIALAAFLADYALVWVINLLIEPTIAKYSEVSAIFDWFQIGSACLALIVAFVIAFFSALSQMRFAYETATEPSFGEANNEQEASLPSSR